MNEAGDANMSALAEAMEPFNGPDLAEYMRDPERTDQLRRALAKIGTPDLVTVMIGSESGFSGTFEGPDGFVEGWRDFLAAFSSFRNEVQELTKVDPDTILALSRQVAITTTGGVEMENEAAAIFRFEQGRLARVEFHLDPESARRAAGLDPD